MTPEEEAEAARLAELEDLNAKLAVRRGRLGFGANVRAIEARIAELEAMEAESPAE